MPNNIPSNGNGLLSVNSQKYHGKEQLLNDCLTVDLLFKETYTVQFNGEKKRELGRMSWPENTNGTLAETRVLFINQLVGKLDSMLLQKQKPLILVSLGSSGLLTEYFIHKGLTHAGFTSLHWRFLDPLYDRGQQGLEAVEDFADRAQARVATFTSDKDYLNPKAPSRPSCGQDCQAGGMVLLSFGPPESVSMLIQENSPNRDNNISLASLRKYIRASQNPHLFASLHKSEFTFE